MQAVYDYVRDSIVHKDRPFYLFETPPKRTLVRDKRTLFAAKLVPSCILYFAWEGLPETKIEHGPFIDIAGLRKFVF